MIFKWPFCSRRNRETPVLTAIFIADAAGEPMQSVHTIRAIHDSGLQGDRYAAAKGFWQSIEACQVTLITEDDIRKAKRAQKEDLKDRLDRGSHRRNLVLGGIRTKQLEGKTFRIGSAVFSYLKPRPPCGYLEKVEGKGLCRALGKSSGVCIRVIASGTITVGDTLAIMN